MMRPKNDFPLCACVRSNGSLECLIRLEPSRPPSELLEQLLERGLSGVELVIADEHAGLAAALRRFLPEVRRQPHWARLRTTNSLERLHTEIKRRIRSAGAFPDRASALRLITAVALRTTALWSERRYLDLSLLEPKEVAKAA